MVEVIMPKVDMAMTEGTIAVWHRREGEQVREGEPLFDVMTDKADIEVEAPASGVLWGVKAAPGETVPIAQIVAYILAPGETPPLTHGDAPQPAAHAISNGATTHEHSHATAASDATTTFAPRLRATPLARRLSREHQIDLAQVAGSGPRGRVERRDVLLFLETRDTETSNPVVPEPQPVAPSAQPAEDVTRVPLSGLRRVVAERMLASVRNTPHFTLQMQVDMGEMVELRRRVSPAIERQAGVKPSFTALLVRVIAPLLLQHPYLNASLEGDTILLHRNAHVGIALDREGDLLVPVIREAHQLSLGQVAAALADITNRAQARKLAPAELRGSTFTISNLGMFGVDSFTAIINPPESAILAVGRIAETPVARDGAMVLRPIMQMTLSADHRIVDGATAARFMADVRERLENPYLLL